MRNMPYFALAMSELPECWLYKDGQFIYVEGNLRPRTLPTIDIANENELKELNIPYRVIKDKYENDVCEYWNPECYKEVALTLPIYVKLPSGDFRYAEKNHTDILPDKETVEAAWAFKEKVEDSVYELEEKKIIKRELYPKIKKALDGRKACGYYQLKIIQEDIIVDDDHFKMIPVELPRGGISLDEYTGWYAVFDVNKIELDSVLTLEVPKGKEGLFVGRNGWQAKAWCKQLGVKRINVVGF